MPQPELPPTPSSSLDIERKDGAHFSSLQMSFELPPPALAESRPSLPKSPKATPPTGRKRSSSVQKNKDSFALPPPPTRSRKIIQMKPRGQEEQTPKSPPTKASPAPTKKKQPSASTASGRKIARKTAHSLIERRRRSKMNEEFGVLKNMIPACTGEMHKLAILQASIDYVRYLEDCVAQLKAQNSVGASPTQTSPKTMATPLDSFKRRRFEEDEEASDDVDMTASEATSPAYTAATPRSHQPSISPAIMPQDSHGRHQSYSSASTDPRHYSFSTSTTTSPVFGPQRSNAGSALISPALLPQRDFDQEATAALLMLNTDRRGTNGSATGRGMSVRDLLST